MLEIRALEGDGERFPAGRATYRGFTIQVVDGAGAPVAGAEVTFRMPESGATGRFANGGAEERTVTDAEGKASAWGIRWNASAGECRISVLAAAAGARAGTTLSAILSDPPSGAGVGAPSFELPAREAKTPPAAAPSTAEKAPAPPEPRLRRREEGAAVVLTRTETAPARIPGSSRKWIWISLAAAGAVGGLLAYRMSSASAGTAGAPVTPPQSVINPPARPSVGNPTISVIRP